MSSKQKWKTKICFTAFVAVLIILLCFVNSTATITSRTNSKSTTSHEPISIQSNNDFTAENGVISGSGTQADPYIIENWEIDASTATGIDIRNTDAYFVIKNCVIHEGKDNLKHYMTFAEAHPLNERR